MLLIVAYGKQGFHPSIPPLSEVTSQQLAVAHGSGPQASDRSTHSLTLSSLGLHMRDETRLGPRREFSRAAPRMTLPRLSQPRPADTYHGEYIYCDLCVLSCLLSKSGEASLNRPAALSARPASTRPARAECADRRPSPDSCVCVLRRERCTRGELWLLAPHTGPAPSLHRWWACMALHCIHGHRPPCW
jgi:hypothetical protein